jgi:asparagine synthase (glutamine-hydrolysing)
LGVKPLLVYEDKDKLIFASEMKALMAYDIPKEIDYTSLYTYLQLNYIPAPHSILENVRKLMPGHYLEIQNGKITDTEFYKIPFEQKRFLQKTTEDSYEKQKLQLRELLEQAVERRLISDVPLGAFLSGGTDSSIIVSIASKMVPDLKTYSMGFKDEKFFDETDDAIAVAELNKTNHTVFNISTDDIFAELFNILDYIDEPFADSSALALNVLSKHTSKHVKVVLSGDGADELFAGYNKHRAEWLVSKEGILNFMKYGEPILKSLPKSRHSALGNAVRKMHRFAKGAKLIRKERYWRWCGFIDENEADELLLKKFNREDYHKRKVEILKYIYSKGDINDILFTDVELVLANDMLVKVDMMSMTHGLEVRSPFLDYHVAEFAFTLPESSKINVNLSKRILKDTFNKDLPSSIRTKKKKGFEVPLLKWLQTDLREMITKDLLSDEFIENQKIFDVDEVKKLRMKLISNNPEEVHAQIWGLVVFQYWWKKYIM